MKEPLDDAVREALEGIFNMRLHEPIQEAPAIARWLATHAEPNDAMLIADLVYSVIYSREGGIREACAPLVEWLLTKGSAELRSGRRARLVTQLVPFVLEYGPRELLAAAIRHVLYNDEPLGSDRRMRDAVEALVPAVEQEIGASGSSSIVGDLVEALTPDALAFYAQSVLAGWQQVPRSRSEVLRRLADGSIRPPDGVPVWAAAMQGPCVVLTMADADIARSAARGLVQRMVYADTLEFAVTSDWDRRAWGGLVAGELVRTAGLLFAPGAGAREDVSLLQKCAGFHADAIPGVHRAVLDAVEAAADPKLDPVLAMLKSPGTEPAVVGAALELLVEATRSAPKPATTGPSLAHVLDGIRVALTARVPAFCGFNLTDVVGGATEAGAKRLEGERAFLVEDQTLWVSEPALEGLLAVSEDPDVQRALGVLYAIHELVHEFQGIADKSDVSRVRFAGAESALMHLDLGADHVAAVVTSRVFPDWDLLWLEDWAGRSIPAFPAGPRSPACSRIRKTLRLVGLRTDLALRKLGLAHDHLTPESYGFADFAPGGGAFIALVNRPPFVVVKSSTISAADASTLFSGIDGGDGVMEKVDDVIERVLRG